MKYQIQYEYTTGDSEHTGIEIDVLEFEWENIEVAKQNLSRIQEHYTQYQQLENSYPHRDKQDYLCIFENNKDKDWFVNKPLLVAYSAENEKYWWAIDKTQIEKVETGGYKTKYISDPSTAQNQIILYMDNGNTVQLWPPWCGYFERLHSAKIITTSVNNDMEIYF